MKKKSIVLFTGGTGGHVIPATNFGNYLIDNGYDCILFIDKRGIKYASKFKGKIIIINSSHFSGNLLFKFNAVISLIIGLFQSILHLFFLRPSYCLAFGSYAASMPLLATTFLKLFFKIKIYLHEQNSIMGKVNLFFSPLSEKIFINFFEIAKINKKYENKICMVGLPYDKQFKNEKRKTKIENKDIIRIFIYGGSQGSVNLNNGFVNILKKIDQQYYKNFNIIFQSSSKYTDQLKSSLDGLKINYEIRDFFININSILDKSDIVISRSGAGTVNDIINSQIPSILVPLPHSINNHQFFNANYLFEKKAAILIEENEWNLDKAYKIFKDLCENINLRESLIKNLQSIKILNANKLMFDIIFK